MAKWLKITLISILIASIMGVAVWFIFFSGIIDKSKKYTYAELQEMYNAGVADEAKNSNSLRLRISALEVEITVKNAQIEELETKLAEAEELNETISDLNQEINRLKIERDSLIIQQEELKEGYQQIIDTYANEIIELTSEVDKLKNELEEYQNNTQDMVYVNFYDGDTLFRTVAVRKYGHILIDVDEPVKYGYLFDGWVLDDEVIDISTYNFNCDMNLFAHFTIDEYSLLGMLQNTSSAYKELIFVPKNETASFDYNYSLRLSKNTSNSFIIVDNCMPSSGVFGEAHFISSNSASNTTQYTGKSYTLSYNQYSKILTITSNDNLTYEYKLIGYYDLDNKVII